MALVVGGTAPRALTEESEAGSPPPLHAVIDQQIDAALKQQRITASGTADDAEFLRRVYLDLTGNIPEVETARAFLEDADPEKRAKLIDRLLASREYARHMAEVFDVMLMERHPDKHVTTPEWRAYLAESFASGKPLDELVREILGADGAEGPLRPAAKFYLDRNVEINTLVRDVGRLFLGVDLQCAQCHDHPTIDDYLNAHYYGLTVFLSGTSTFRDKSGLTVLQEKVVREVEFASVFEPDNMKKTGPRLLDGPVMEMPEFAEGEEYEVAPSKEAPSVPKFSLRKLLAEELPRAENVAFSRNMANRLWALMMGRGLVDPLSMHHAANPPSHPELLDALAARLAADKFDMRSFLRAIALSQAYQRTSRLPEADDGSVPPPESYAAALLKGLSPDQLYRSLVRATGNERILAEAIEDELKTDPERYRELQEDPPALEQARGEQLAERMKEFVDLFGSPAGQPQGEFQPSLPQALFLANGATIAAWIEPSDGNLSDRLMDQPDPARVADELYLSVLSRRPTADEAKLVKQHLEARRNEGASAMMELVWSLLGSAEFRLNH